MTVSAGVFRWWSVLSVRRGLVTPPSGPRTRLDEVEASGSVSALMAEQRR